MRVSVIIPVRNAPIDLEKCLAALAVTEHKPCWECIVVDDASTDATPDVAHKAGARVVSLGENAGPAKARNQGALQATGDILFFIDSDVLVKPDTIERVAEAFESDPKLDGLIGSYDDEPGSRDFISQYKNLMHCYVHQNGRRKSSTFWSGCGAIRRELFHEMKGFDETYERPCIEDIELGYRLMMQGRIVMLDPDLQVKHLKRWTFWGLIKTDIFDRGIPWTELILRDRHMPDDLNIQISQRVSVAVMFLLVALALFAAFRHGQYFLVPAFALLFLVVGHYWAEFSSGTGSKTAKLASTGAFALVLGQAWLAGFVELVPLLAVAGLLSILRHRYHYKTSLERNLVRLALGAVAGCGAAFALWQLPSDPLIYGCFLLLAAAVALNNQFYLFLAEKRGHAFAIAAVPFHLLYHLYNGISFIVGTLSHARGKISQKAEADVDVRAR